MRKFRDLADRLVDDCLIATHNDFLRPMDPPHDWFVSVHSSEYYYGFVNGTLDDTRWRRIGFAQRPNHAALVRRTRLEVAGTMLAARHALQYGIACNTAGGTHHAHRTWGSGYTVVNDLAIVAKVLLSEGAVSRILICDLDVHHGDGTAEIFAKDSRVFTFSMHCGDNFPCGLKGMPHLGLDRGDLDVEISPGTGDLGYLAALESHLPSALAEHNPDLVLYNAGVGVHAHDELGRLNLTWDGLRHREEAVLESCLSRGVPVACVIGGGYDRDPVNLAQRHAVLHHAAANAWRKYRLA